MNISIWYDIFTVTQKEKNNNNTRKRIQLPFFKEFCNIVFQWAAFFETCERDINRFFWSVILLIWQKASLSYSNFFSFLFFDDASGKQSMGNIESKRKIRKIRKIRKFQLNLTLNASGNLIISFILSPLLL